MVQILQFLYCVSQISRENVVFSWRHNSSSQVFAANVEVLAISWRQNNRKMAERDRCHVITVWQNLKSILRILDFCTVILRHLGKLVTGKNINRSTEHCWLVTWQMTSRKRHMSRHQWRASAYCWQWFGDLKQWVIKQLFQDYFGNSQTIVPR